MSSTKKLSELSIGEEAVVCALMNEKCLKRRLIDLGVFPGARLEPLFRAVCGDPTAYLIQNAVIALRRSDAEKIVVSPL